MELTDLQKSLWDSCGDNLLANQKIRNLTQQYYMQYRQHLKSIYSFQQNQEKIHNLFSIAYFISEKSEVVTNLKGQKISNIGFSINQLAKNHKNYKQFFFHLKQMMRIIKLPDQAKHIQIQMNSFIKYFSFIMTFYNKFLSTFQKIKIVHNINKNDLQNLGGESQYCNKIKYLLWLMFIGFRKTVLRANIDTIVNTCLLSCLFSYSITKIYQQQKITSIFSQQIVEDLGTFPNQYQQIESIFLNFFSLKDMKTYINLKNLFLKFIQQKLQQTFNDDRLVFNPKNIVLTIKKFQKFYDSDIQSISYLDEKLFLNNLISHQQNIRFTAFGGIRKINKQQNQNKIQCRKVLNYELQMNKIDITVKKEPENIEIDPKNYVNIFNRIKIQKTPQTQTILIRQTPLTQFTNLYNWLFKKSQIIRQKNQSDERQLDLTNLLNIGYCQEEFQLGNQQIIQKRELIQGIFCELLQEYQQQTQQIINVCTILALQVFYYVMNITNRQLSVIVQYLNASWFSIWLGIHKLLNYDKTIPISLKKHLLFIQASIICTYIWQDQQMISQLSKKIQKKSLFYQFYLRIIHHIAYQISFICRQFYSQDQIMNDSLILVQYYLNQHSQLMSNMNLDVVIMCAIYGVNKARNKDKKFKQIMAIYKNINNLNDKFFSSIQNFQFQGESYNIINYYNKIFLKYTKGILMKIKQKNQLINDERLKSRNYLFSPLKQILPTNLTNNNYSNYSHQHNPNQMLYAYNQSPLLKKGKNSTILNKNNTLMKQIQNQLFHWSSLKNISCQKDILRDRSNNISQMIQKKFGNKNNISSTIHKRYHGGTKQY